MLVNIACVGQKNVACLRKVMCSRLAMLVNIACVGQKNVPEKQTMYKCTRTNHACSMDHVT